MGAVWRKWKQRHRRRYRQTFGADAQTQTQTRSHNTVAGGWWMMFGLRRLHFIREADKLCAKFCVLFILSGLWWASVDNRKSVSWGVHNTSMAGPGAQVITYVINRSPWKLASQAAMMDYLQWTSRFLQCLRFIIGCCVESVVLIPTSSWATNAVKLHQRCLIHPPHERSPYWLKHIRLFLFLCSLWWKRPFT